jgi:hypothetical protein
MMNTSAKHANSTYKNKGSFASSALFADSYPLSEIRERKVEACALFPSTNYVTHTIASCDGGVIIRHTYDGELGYFAGRSGFSREPPLNQAIPSTAAEAAPTCSCNELLARISRQAANSTDKALAL